MTISGAANVEPVSPRARHSQIVPDRLIGAKGPAITGAVRDLFFALGLDERGPSGLMLRGYLTG